MDILIKGLEMPKGNDVLIVDSAGTITKFDRWTGKAEATDPFKVKAIELPPHGELVNLSAVYEAINREIVPKGVFLSDFYKAFADIPVVLERTT